MANNNETTTKFKVDITELKSAIQEAKRHIRIANSEFRSVSSSMQTWEKTTDGVKAKLKQLDSNLISQKNILKSLESQYNLTAKQMGKDSAAAENLKISINNQKAVINKTENQIKYYNESLLTAEKAEKIAAQTGKDAAKVFDDLSQEAKKAGNSAKGTSDGFTVMKGALASIIGDLGRKAINSIIDLGKQSIKTGMDFEKSMSEVKAISGATGESYQKLEEKARQCGESTIFSASESAQALKFMALAGWDVEKSTNSLEGVLNLAAASGMDLAEASELATDTIQAFGMTSDDAAEKLANRLVYAQDNCSTTAKQLGEAYKNSASNMHAAGQDIETTTALLAMMANQGLKGSESGTALNAIVRDMTARMKDGKIIIGKTAVSVQDANGNFRNMIDVLRDVDKATNGMGSAEKAAALQTTFTAESTKGLNHILSAGVDQAEEFSEKLRNVGDVAKETSDTMNDNAEGDLKKMQSALEETLISMYKEIAPLLRTAIQWITDNLIPGLKFIFDGLNEIKKIMESISPIIAGLGTSFGILFAAQAIANLPKIIQLMKSWTVVTKLQALAQGALNLIMNTNPIILIISVIAGLIAAFVALWNNSEDFRNFWLGLWESISKAVGDAIGGIVEFFVKTIPDTFNGVIDWIKENWVHILEFLINPFAGLFHYFYDHCDEFRKFVDNAINFIKELPGGIWTWLTQTIKIVQEWGKNLVQNGIDAAKNLVNNVVNWIQALPGQIVEIGGNIVKGLWDGMCNMGGWLKRKIEDFGNSILDGIKDFFGIHSPSRLMRDEIGKWIPKGIAVGIEANAKSALNTMKNLSADLVGTTKTTLLNSSNDLKFDAKKPNVVYNFYQTNNSPKPLSRLEIYRQSKNLLQYANIGGEI